MSEWDMQMKVLCALVKVLRGSDIYPVLHGASALRLVNIEDERQQKWWADRIKLLLMSGHECTVMPRANELTGNPELIVSW